MGGGGGGWDCNSIINNTVTTLQVTNLPIIVLPMVNVLLLRRYIENVNWLIALPHLLLTFNGIASTYYHATLNLFGSLCFR